MGFGLSTALKTGFNFISPVDVPINTDVTPGFSPANVITTQVKKPFQNSQPASAPKSPQTQTRNEGTPVQESPANLYGAAGGSGGGTLSPQDAALYQQAIDQALAAQDRIGGQEGIALGNIQGDYTSNLDRLLNAKNLTQQKYEGSKIDTNKENIAARSDIDFATGQRANSLQRLLGSRGAGSSSAARVSAPYAAALEGTRRLNQVGDTFSQNMGQLDTSWGDYQNEWNQNRDDLEAQKINQERAARQDAASRRAGLLDTIATLQAQKSAAMGGGGASMRAAAQPYMDQANSLASQVDQLGAQYAGKVRVADPTYKAPDLSEYNYDPRQAFQLQGGAVRADSISPYLSLLLNGEKKKQQQPLY